jgi:Flp pilus assembly protein TadG
MSIFIRRHCHCLQPRLLLLRDARRGNRGAVKAKFSGYGLQAARAESGTSAVEFALLMPVVLALMVGGIVFGIAFNNYLMVTTAAEAGTFQLTVSRGASTPYSTTVAAVDNAAPALTPSQLTVTVTVNGTACASDSACQSALSSAAGQQGTVSVSYPYSLAIIKTFMQAFPWGLGASYSSNIALTSQSTGRIQ